jgi:hypothetical protein
MARPPRKTARAAVPDHPILAAATVRVISTHATAAVVNAPFRLFSSNLSPNTMRWTFSPIVEEPRPLAHGLRVRRGGQTGL